MQTTISVVVMIMGLCRFDRAHRDGEDAFSRVLFGVDRGLSAAYTAQRAGFLVILDFHGQNEAFAFGDAGALMTA